MLYTCSGSSPCRNKAMSSWAPHQRLHKYAGWEQLDLKLILLSGFFFSILLILKARRWKIIECRFLAFQLDLLFLITTATKIWHQTHTTEGKNRVMRLSDLCPSMPGIQNMSKVFHVGKTENYCWRWQSLFSSQMHIFHLTFSLFYGSTRDKLLLNKKNFGAFGLCLFLVRYRRDYNILVLFLSVLLFFPVWY